jgi:hypothetical protein
MLATMSTAMPEWMAACPDCLRLLQALREAGYPTGGLGEFEMVISHLVDAHLADLPDYDETCSNCQEWQMSAGDPTSGLPLTAVVALGREDLKHRAGHLLATLSS